MEGKSLNAAIFDLENVVFVAARLANDNPAPSVEIWNGDCIDLMLEMDADSVDLIVTSPPYPDHDMAYGDAYGGLKQFQDFSLEWIDHAARVLKPGGALWINVGYYRADKWLRRVPMTYYLFPIGERVGLQFIQEIVWNPSSRQASSKSRFSIKSERWMYWVKPGGTRTFNLDAVKEPPKPGDKRNNKHYSLPVDVWTFNKVNGNSKKRTAHPCPFPDDMIERIVLACSNLGDIVLDPFGGSGTTGVAAKLHQRSAILLEQSAEYCEIARTRVA